MKDWGVTEEEDEAIRLQKARERRRREAMAAFNHTHTASKSSRFHMLLGEGHTSILDTRGLAVRS